MLWWVVHKTFQGYNIHPNILGKILDTEMKMYNNFLIVGDFNSEMVESAMQNVCETYHLHNLIKDPACFKNTYKPSCIDLLLTYQTNKLLTNFGKKPFLKSQTLETGWTDFHKSTLTVIKIHYKKQKSLVVTYRDYKNFSNGTLRREVLSAMERYSNISFFDFHLEFICLVSMHQLGKDTLEPTRKNLWTKNLIKQPCLGLNYVITFWNSKLKKIRLHMLSSATIV